MRIGQLIAQRCAELDLTVEQVAERMLCAGYDPMQTQLWRCADEYKHWSRLNNAVFCHALAAALDLDVHEMLCLLEYNVSSESVPTLLER